MSDNTLFQIDDLVISSHAALAKLQTEIAAIQSDPIFSNYKAMASKITKLEKKLEPMKKKAAEFEAEIRRNAMPSPELPVQTDNIEVLQVHIEEVARSYGKKRTTETRDVDYLLLRAFGSIVRVEEFSIFGVALNHWRTPANETLQDFLGIDEDSLTCEISKITELTELPAFIKKLEADAMKSCAMYNADSESADDDETQDDEVDG